MQTVLIVDDKHHNRNSYKLALEDGIENIQVVLAKNEMEAINVLQTGTPIDVVITDLMMKSEMGGLDVLNAAKRNDPLIMVILITAYDKKLDRHEAFSLGAFDCLEKSVIGVKTSDELVYKTKHALNLRRTTISLLESHRKMDLLKKYFDPSVLGKIENDIGLLKPRNRTVTIVFWDIRGFSLLSEILKAHPNLLSEFLKEYFEAASKIIFKNKGVLDKFVGDAVMALFGCFNEFDVEQSSEGENEDAIRAVTAATELRHEFEQIYQRWTKRWERVTADNIDIGLGCGIHTGDALVGNLGTDVRDHYTAIGPHVNLASRIESSSEKGQVRISKTTKSRIDGKFTVRKVADLSNIKNIPGNYEIFEII